MLGLASPATAQAAAQAAPSGAAARTTIYPAAFFAQFAPRTALDIAQRVPGFTLDLGVTQSQSRRSRRTRLCRDGGQCRDQRRAAEHQGRNLDITLARIPAQRVVRVELGPGDLYGSDYAGKSQVLNVSCRSRPASTAMSRPRPSAGSPAMSTPTSQASALIRRGASTINLSAGTGPQHASSRKAPTRSPT